MSGEAPSWREITTDEYAPRIFPETSGSAQWIASSDRVYELLKGQHEGQYRLRLILCEAVDLKRGPNANALWYWDYDAGPPAITCVAETWIQAKDGRRRRVGENGFAR
ncbi:hypothetical protein ASG63_09570 [Methylobacterium sp. Leaf94]|uniref:hypothetical protein n=1 Tax=Methylobacterium sp. Leaf94 TaxID=1736250 RepID=UPI0007004F70|nr:hypothetical protein [Methylobacterium sp. Leaf94]KQU17728.1 hypothetical protein ASG63_09570 [Methylobacterium sp. Leaf94]